MRKRNIQRIYEKEKRSKIAHILYKGWRYQKKKRNKDDESVGSVAAENNFWVIANKYRTKTRCVYARFVCGCI